MQAEMCWVDAYRSILPYMVKIRTPNAYGSGFVMNYQLFDNGIRQVAVATAGHVVKHAHDWGEQIMVEYSSEKTLHTYKLVPSERIVVIDDDKDIALLAFPESDEPHFPQRFPDTIDGQALPPGSPVGWCGFPNIAESSSCFFSGHISATYASVGDYLVDGVVIHGVSGGPCFTHNGKSLTVMGLVSAYFANRSTGEALPGLGLIRSIVPLVEALASAHKANSRKKALKRR